MKMTLIVLAVGFVLYVVWIVLLYGVRKSISESYYYLQKTGHGYYFTGFMFLITVCLIILAGNVSGEYSWLLFLAGGGAGFVGTAVSYQQKLTRGVHFAGASVLIVSSLLGLGLIYGNWIPALLLLAVLIFLILVNDILKNLVYWFEIAAFVLIISGLFIEVL